MSEDRLGEVGSYVGQDITSGYVIYDPWVLVPPATAVFGLIGTGKSAPTGRDGEGGA